MERSTIPTIDVGLIYEKEVHFILHGEYSDMRGDVLTGSWKVWFENDALYLSNDLASFQIDEGFLIIPENENCTVTIRDITIGIGFHWERKEDQVFKGGLRFIIENKKVTVINRLNVEDYLASVISSEMSATSSPELLKAHAVISRSWLLAQIEKNRLLAEQEKKYTSFVSTDLEHIRWYDREDHDNFDVCADDHCQRYQGITRATTAQVEEAIRSTFGEVLTYKDQLCDARFSKCCGGMTEIFENTWEPVNHPYLQKLPDYDGSPEGYSTDLENEESAGKWIMGRPDAWCNTNDKTILAQVLNDYDRETNDFFRWHIRYSQKEVSDLILNRIGIDVGQVEDFIPVERGTSGRLIKLKIVGTRRTVIIGKELEIRKALSSSHLYSSAIVFEKEQEDGEIFFTMYGAGWGHGVGLCQIGAAVMGARGYGYREILQHYFRGAMLEKRY